MSTTIEEIEKTETSEDKKSELLLDSLEITGYRCFEHLAIEKLGRVNLIVGKNNIGKTAFLEAIYAYVNKGDVQILTYLLLSRNEAVRGFDQPNNRRIIVDYSFLPLFSAKRDSENNNRNLVIRGRLDGEEEALYLSLPKLRTEDGKLTEIGQKISSSSKVFAEDEGFTLEIKYIREKTGDYDLEYYTSIDEGWIVERKRFHRINNVFIGVDSLRSDALLALWDNTNKNNLKKPVISAMQLLEGNIIDISFLGTPSGSNNLLPYAEVLNEPFKLPIRRFGHGMTRLLGLSLALTNSLNGILFIDEIETGLHYSVLPNVWKLIFKMAKDLNVQVFATTHSKDCIEAFTEAAINSPEEGVLIRLECKEGIIRAVNFNENELEIVERRDIEVR